MTVRTAQTLPTATPKRKLLGERLIEAGLITPDQLDLALREQKRTGERIGEILINLIEPAALKPGEGRARPARGVGQGKAKGRTPPPGRPCHRSAAYDA